MAFFLGTLITQPDGAHCLPGLDWGNISDSVLEVLPPQRDLRINIFCKVRFSKPFFWTAPLSCTPNESEDYGTPLRVGNKHCGTHFLWATAERKGFGVCIPNAQSSSKHGSLTLRRVGWEVPSKFQLWTLFPPVLA